MNQSKELRNFEFEEILDHVRTVAISGHVRPDGDCVGSCLGLYLFLKKNYPEITVRIFLEEFPDSFLFLKGADEICSGTDRDTAYDLFFVLDCSDLERLGKNAECFRRAGKTACIDHHITNRIFTDYYWIVPHASSASELVYDLIGMDRIDYDMAEALYLGIAHDTGVFQYSSTSSHTMRVAGELMDKGIPFSEIVQDTFFSKTYRQEQILGRALLESVRLMDGKVVFSAVHMKDMAFYQADSRDLEGIVSQLRLIRGVDVAIFLHEVQPQVWKVSLRSSEAVDVSIISEYFGGGGHMRAAGCTMQGSVHDVINNLTLHIEKQLSINTEN